MFAFLCYLLFEGLQKNTFARGLKQLLATLQINNCLQELVLSWNKLRSKGVIAFVESLRPNLALQVLGMAWCGMSDVGALAMGETLKANHVSSQFLSCFC